MSTQHTYSDSSTAMTSSVSQQPSHIAVSVNHPRLLNTDPQSIRSFLKDYDQYSRTVFARARQLNVGDSSTVTTEAVKPVDLKFCVDAQYLTSSIALGFIQNVTSFEELDETTLRSYLDREAEESKESVTLDTLDDIVQKKLKMNMSNRNARSRMQGLFVDYHSLLSEHGLTWILEENQKVAVGHVLSAIRPLTLKERLDSDLSFSHHELKKDFTKFLSHAVRLSEAFQIVDSGPRNKKTDGKNKNRSGTSNYGMNGSESTTVNGKNKTSKEKPVCLYEPHKQRGLRHYLKDCRDCPDDEKRRLLSDLAAEKQKDGPSRSTRSQTSSKTTLATVSASTSTNSTSKQTAGRISKITTSPGCSITLFDDEAKMECHGRCDDGSDDTIVSPRIAEAAVLKGIGKIKTIPSVKLQVALKEGEDAQSFTFSRSWKVPRLVLHLAVGQLALLNISFLIADAELAGEDLLIGLPVLQHLGIDSKTMLENNRATLDGTDCSNVLNPATNYNSVGRLMLARIQRISGTSPIKDRQSITNNNQLNPQRIRTNYFTNRTEQDPFPNPALIDIQDGDQEDDVKSAISDMLENAKNQGFPSDFYKELESLVQEHTNIFRTTFSKGPPVNVPPIRFELKPDATPIVVKIRNYSADQRSFLQKLTDQLIDVGLIYHNPFSKWACAPHLVPKPGPAQWRFTGDYRPVNHYIVPIKYPLPVVEHELTKASGAQFFANFDMSHSYWQFQVHEDCQELQSFITPDGIFTPTRLMHGNVNSNAHLHSSIVNNMSNELRSRILIWVDDILLPSKTIADHLYHLRQLFKFCVNLNIKLHPRKCILFTPSVTWCGRTLSKKGFRFDPRNISGLENMNTPSNGSELLQFVSAMQWVRSSIPNFSAIIQPLMDALERSYNLAGKRNKKSLRRIQLHNINWGQTEISSFEKCKEALRRRITLSHRDENKRLCFYVDASDTHWAGLATQIPMADIHLSHQDKRHEPLAFLSGHFTSTQLRWSTFEKEAFSIMATVERMHWIASTPNGFDLFTDHNNLVFLFDPLALVPDLSQSSLRKVVRWAVRMCIYNYVCIHISGDDNVWADLLSRWTPQPTIRRLISIPPLPSASSPEFEWPSSDSISSIQNASSTRPDNLYCSKNIWYTQDNRIWIPHDAENLQLRLCIIAHTSTGGHRGKNATVSSIKRRFYWDTLEPDVALFIQACIHCLSTKGGERIPRPFGPSVHGTKPNDLLQFDYIEIGQASSGDKYILMLRDDHSGYSWLYPSPSTDAEQAAHAIMDWCAAFGPPSGLMSDGPTHFKNETLRLLAKGLHSPHHFTQPYCPWSNGAVERLGKELLRVARSLLSELQLRLDTWPDLVPIFQSVLNNSPSQQRNNIAPITSFTGLSPSTPISTFIRSVNCHPVSISDAQREKSFNIAELIKIMDELHPIVQNNLEENRRRIRESHSKGTLPNFCEGDFVLVARNDFFEGEKLCLRWRGPRRIIKALNDYVFQVEDLRNGSVTNVHGSRLKFYSDSSLDTTAIMSHVLNSETGMPVARLLRLQDTADGLMVQVRWKGLEPIEDTLEPVSQVYDDVPKLFLKLLERKSTPKNLVDKARVILAL